MASSAANRGSANDIKRWIRLLLIAVCMFVIFGRLLGHRGQTTMQMLSSSSGETTRKYLSEAPPPSIGTRTSSKRRHHKIHGHSTTTTTTTTTIRSEPSAPREDDGHGSQHHYDETEHDFDFDFDGKLWPELRQRLCPRGVPRHSLGPTLFELGRREMGIPWGNNNSSSSSSSSNDTQSGSNNNNDGSENTTKQEGHTVSEFFYHGSFGFTVFIDGKDPSNTVLYAPIWKGANNQIHAYLHLVFNRKTNGHVRRPDLAVGNDSDFYLQGLRDHDITFLFHKKFETVRQQTTDNETLGAENDNSNEDDRDSDSDRDGGKDPHQTAAASEQGDESGDDYYFLFNQTKRGKPCSFTVIRDPISHFLSGYNEVEFRLIRGVGDAPPPSRHDELAPYSRMPWSSGNGNGNGNPDSEADPSGSIDENDDDDDDDNSNELYRQLREDRFEQFVRDVLNEHPSFVEFPYYKHFASMTRILPMLSTLDLLPSPIPSQTKMTTMESSLSHQNQDREHDHDHDHWFLPSLDNLTDVFPEFFAARCPRVAANYHQRGSASAGDSAEPQRLPPMPVRGRHDSSQDRYGTYRAAKDVWKKGGTVARALCHLHAVDYACFSGSYNDDDDDDGNNGNNGNDDNDETNTDHLRIPGLELPRVCREVYAGDEFRDAILPSSPSSSF